MKDLKDVFVKGVINQALSGKITNAVAPSRALFRRGRGRSQRMAGRQGVQGADRKDKRHAVQARAEPYLEEIHRQLQVQASRTREKGRFRRSGVNKSRVSNT